jgi:hypothetical protein
MATKYTRWPQNIPNGHKIYQMAIKYTKYRIGTFVLKIYHLATLNPTRKSFKT